MGLVDRAPRPTPSWLIAIILVVAALHWMQVLALPMAFSLFLMALVWPVQTMIAARLPRGIAIAGHALAISLFIVVASIFFWGLVWGIPGAFIGVPLTIAIVTVCHRFHEACWIARLLTPKPQLENVENEADG